MVASGNSFSTAKNPLFSALRSALNFLLVSLGHFLILILKLLKSVQANNQETKLRVTQPTETPPKSQSLGINSASPGTIWQPPQEVSAEGDPLVAGCS